MGGPVCDSGLRSTSNLRTPGLDRDSALVAEGIDSISLNPDAVLKTRLAIAAMEKELGIEPGTLPAVGALGKDGEAVLIPPA
jgi:hypothetical protein